MAEFSTISALSGLPQISPCNRPPDMLVSRTRPNEAVSTAIMSVQLPILGAQCLAQEADHCRRSALAIDTWSHAQPRRSAPILGPTCGPPLTGTVGPVSRPAAGAMLTLLRLSRSPPAAGANFLRPARDNRPLLRPRAGLRFIRRLS